MWVRGDDKCPGSLILYADNDNQRKITQMNKNDVQM